jgi:hypothetical protein
VNQKVQKAINVSSEEPDLAFFHNLASQGFKRESVERQALIAKYELGNQDGRNDNKEESKKEERKYTQDEKESKAYEQGFKNGWQAAKDKFWAEGFDAGLKEAAKEEREKKDQTQS